MNNFVRTTNPFSLPEPPEWFLKALYAYDDQLVVFQSLEDCCYQLCRRLNHRRELKPLAKHPDTVIYAQHRMFGVKRILPPVEAGADVWMQVLNELPDFDQWRFSSADAACDHLDSLEAAADAAVQRRIDDGLVALGEDAYNLTKTRLGERISMRERRGSPVPEKKRYGKLNFKPGGSSIMLTDPKPLGGWSG